MKNFISTLYIKTNSASDEKICIGMFAGGEEKSFFAWSEHKLKLINKLINEEVYHSLHKTLTNLKNDISDIIIPSDQPEIFVSNKYSADYFRYLSNYSKGLIEFGEPRIIPTSINAKEFQELYQLMVGESLETITPSKNKDTLAKHIKSALQKTAFKERTDTFYKVQESVISTIYRPTEVDFISCNGSVFAGQSIDFTQSANTVENKLYEFRVLSEGLKIFAKSRNMSNEGKYIVYYNDPSESEQSKILSNAQKDSTKPFLFKEIEALDEAEAILNKDNYKKFSEIL